MSVNVQGHSVIIIAPPGAGKTQYAQQLKEIFGLSIIVDEWDGKHYKGNGHLYLANLYTLSNSKFFQNKV